MILSHYLPVECGGKFECGERTRHPRGSVDCAVMKKRVATMQHPTVSGVDRYAGVAAGVSRQRNQHDSRRHLVKLLRGSEASPLLSLRSVLDDLGAVRPLHRAEAEPLSARRGAQRAERLCGSDVYLGLGEFGYAADVVAIEMRDDDVAHVVPSKTELLDLSDGGFLALQHWADEVSRRPHPLCGIAAVFRPEAGVDQDQTVVGLDEQHVAHHPATPVGVQGSAVEVVNLHTSSVLDERPRRERPPRLRTTCADVAVRRSPDRTPMGTQNW